MGKDKSLERVEVQGKEKLRGKGEIFGEGGGIGKGEAAWERRNLWRGWRYEGKSGVKLSRKNTENI